MAKPEEAKIIMAYSREVMAVMVCVQNRIEGAAEEKDRSFSLLIED